MTIDLFSFRKAYSLIYFPDSKYSPPPGCSHLEKISRLFPSRESKLVFGMYVMMLVAHGMLATASRHGSSSYSYNTVTVVLICELLKLFVSSLVYFKE